MRRHLDILPDPTGGLPISQMLETCVKNCGRRFHEHVVQKEALDAVAKLAQRSRVRRGGFCVGVAVTSTAVSCAPASRCCVDAEAQPSICLSCL